MDMRKGFEECKLKAGVRGGALFAFTSKKRTQPDGIYRDTTGLLSMTKRLLN